MANSKLGLAVIGCGRVAQHYLKLFSEGSVPSCRFVSCYDLDPVKARRFAEESGARVASSLHDALADSAVEVAVILTPSGLHFEHTHYAIEMGLHAVVEKPLALRLEHAKALIKLARERQIMLVPVMQNRYNAAIQFARQVVESNSLGRIHQFSVRLFWSRPQTYYEDGWHGTWLMDGGVTSQQAIHHLDALQYLAGGLSSVVAAETRSRLELEAEDTMVAIGRLLSGGLGTIHLTTAVRSRDFEGSVTLVGSDGHLVVGGIALNKVLEFESIHSEGRKVQGPLVGEEVSNGYGSGHAKLLEHVAERLRTGSLKSPIDAESVLGALQLVHALYASGACSEWVKVDTIVESRLGALNVKH